MLSLSYVFINSQLPFLVNDVEHALQLDDEVFKKKYGVEKPDEDGEKLVFFCLAGIRSMKALLISRSLDFEQ